MTGVLLDQELRNITARTAGTNVTIVSEDSADSLSAGISADTNSSAVTDSSLIRRLFAANEEFVLATATTVITGSAALLHDGQLVYWRKDGSKGIVLRQNQGVAIKNITNSTVGSVSYIFEFTDELA